MELKRQTRCMKTVMTKKLKIHSKVYGCRDKMTRSCESSESETSTTKNIIPQWIMAGRWTPAVKDKESAMVKEESNKVKVRYIIIYLRVQHL